MGVKEQEAELNPMGTLHFSEK